MSLIAYNLVMSDDEIKTSNADLINVVEHLNSKMTNYIKIIEDVTKNSIVDGKIHDNLVIYADSVKKLKDIMDKTIPEQIKNENRRYPKDFDEADDILF